MSRVLTLESKGKERIQYQRAIILALRELTKQATIDANTRDLSAFIVVMLEAIDSTIEQSVIAWEKKGYWIKADRFHQEWRWAGDLGRRLRTCVLSEDWEEVRVVTVQVFTKLNRVRLPLRHGLGTPWVGAWAKLTKSSE